MNHAEHKKAKLWKRVKEAWYTTYECVAYAKSYVKDRGRPALKSFWGSAIAWWKSESTFPKEYKRVYNEPNNKPVEGDIIFFAPTSDNKYWHVAVVDEATFDYLEVLEQNWGRWSGDWLKDDAIREDACWYGWVLWWRHYEAPVERQILIDEWIFNWEFDEHITPRMAIMLTKMYKKLRGK